MGPCGISKPIPGIRNSQTSTRFPLRAVRVIIGDALLLTQFPWLQLGNDRNLQGEWRGRWISAECLHIIVVHANSLDARNILINRPALAELATAEVDLHDLPTFQLMTWHPASFFFPREVPSLDTVVFIFSWFIYSPRFLVVFWGRFLSLPNCFLKFSRELNHVETTPNQRNHGGRWCFRTVVGRVCSPRCCSSFWDSATADSGRFHCPF